MEKEYFFATKLTQNPFYGVFLLEISAIWALCSLSGSVFEVKK